MTGTGTGGDGPRHRFLVERPQVLDRPAAARDDDDVDARHAREALEAPRDLATAPSPCTRAGRMTRSAFAYRRRSTFTTSRSAAPSIDVTIPMRRGSTGSRRFRAASKSPSASSRVFKLLEGQLQGAEAERLHLLADDLVLALGLVDAQAAAHEHARAVLRPEAQLPRRRSEHDAAQLRALVLEGEVEVPALIDTAVAEFAFDEQIAVRVLEQATDAGGDLRDGERPRR
jgi:hypothetical protein